MTPLAVTTRVLAEHPWTSTTSYTCRCGMPVLPDQIAAHQADMLAAAGVIPSVQEWGVEGDDRISNFVGLEEDYARNLSARTGHRVITRWTGATAWEAA